MLKMSFDPTKMILERVQNLSFEYKNNFIIFIIIPYYYIAKLLQKIIKKWRKIYKKQDGMIISIVLLQESKKNPLLSMRQICFPN